MTPEVVAHDLHPEYLSTKYALERDGVRARRRPAPPRPPGGDPRRARRAGNGGRRDLRRDRVRDRRHRLGRRAPLRRPRRLRARRHAPAGPAPGRRAGDPGAVADGVRLAGGRHRIGRSGRAAAASGVDGRDRRWAHVGPRRRAGPDRPQLAGDDQHGPAVRRGGGAVRAAARTSTTRARRRSSSRRRATPPSAAATRSSVETGQRPRDRSARDDPGRRGRRRRGCPSRRRCEPLPRGGRGRDGRGLLPRCARAPHRPDRAVGGRVPEPAPARGRRGGPARGRPARARARAAARQRRRDLLRPGRGGGPQMSAAGR